MDKYEKEHGSSPWLEAIDKLFAPYKKQWFYCRLPVLEKKIESCFYIEERVGEPSKSSLKDETFTYCLKKK